MSGKSKKSKGKTLNLDEFLGESKIPDGFKLKTTSWADACMEEDVPDIPSYKTAIDPMVLPTAPKALRANEVDTSRVPNAPPFKAYVGNMPYETNEGEIRNLFKGLHLRDIQIPKEDKGSGRTRGFAYVEFEDRDSLIEALKSNGKSMGSRQIKVSLPEETGRDDNRRSGFNRDTDEDRTTGDWRSGPRTASSMPQRQDRGGFERGSDSQFPSRSESSSQWREDSRPAFGSRNGYQDPVSRGYGGQDSSQSGYGYQERSRGGGYNDRGGNRGFENFANRGYNDFGNRNQYSDQQTGYRDSGHQRFGGDHDASSRYSSQQEDNFSRKDFGKSQDFTQPRPERTRFEDRSSQPRAYNPPSHESEPSEHHSHAAETEPPKERPKLQLQKRTKPLEEIAAPAPSLKNIFGEAKPVDTLKKELEIEEKMKSLEVKTQSESSSQPSSESERMRKTSTSSSGNRSRKESESERPRLVLAEKPPRLQQNQDRNRDFGENRGFRDHNNDNRRDNRPSSDRNFDNRQSGQQRFYDRRDDRRNEAPRRTNDQSRGGSYSGQPQLNRNQGRDQGRGNNPRYAGNDERRQPQQQDNLPPRLRDKDRQIDGQNGAEKKELEYVVRNKYDALMTDEDDTLDKPLTE